MRPRPADDAVIDAEAGSAAASAQVRKYRPELQGLRALAAVLVVVYHVWLGRISGGVDVFFLISGFLITGQLFRAAGRGRIEFRPMWGRMIKRLFPAALTVLLAVVGLSILLLPQDRWFQTIKEVFASALYVENWRLAADSVDYFAQHNTASVVQHYWSLSIQGQFYVVWPLLVAVVAFAAVRLRRSLRATLAGTLAALFAVSLAYSVHLTTVNQPLAYFHSLTRVWEFALGGLLALGIDAIVLPRWSRVLAGWLGVAGLVVCGIVLDVGSVFPGYAALWPTVAAALVILAGATGSRAACRPDPGVTAVRIPGQPELLAVPVALAGAAVLPGRPPPRGGRTARRRVRHRRLRRPRRADVPLRRIPRSRLGHRHPDPLGCLPVRRRRTAAAPGDHAAPGRSSARRRPTSPSPWTTTSTQAPSPAPRSRSGPRPAPPWCPR